MSYSSERHKEEEDRSGNSQDYQESGLEKNAFNFLIRTTLSETDIPVL